MRLYITRGLIALFIVIGWGLLSIPAQAIPTVKFNVTDSFITEGETFSINVLADGVTDIDPFTGWTDEAFAFGFDLSIPSGIIYNGTAVNIVSFDDTSGTLPGTAISGLAFPGVSGNDILLATLSFTSGSAGNYSIGIVSDLLDFNQGLFTLLNPQTDITSSIDLTVHDLGNNNPVSSVPEPDTMVLIFSGLLVLIVIGRKKSIFQKC